MADEQAVGDPADAPKGGEASWRTVREVALLFLKLGTIAFGGPAAHTALT
ncbi:hypothetical protein [Streptosporangium sp. NPDC006930]